MRELVLEEVAMVSGGYTPGEDGPSGDLPNCTNVPMEGTCILPSGNTVTNGRVDNVEVDYAGAAWDLATIGAAVLSGGLGMLGYVRASLAAGAAAMGAETGSELHDETGD